VYIRIEEIETFENVLQGRSMHVADNAISKNSVKHKWMFRKYINNTGLGENDFTEQLTGELIIFKSIIEKIK
jgi:hypothetical protein